MDCINISICRHMSRVHYGGKGHECFCGKIYKTKLNLRSHQSGVHVKRKNYCEVIHHCKLFYEKNYVLSFLDLRGRI